MKLGYCILYVPDVAKTVAFYEKAFAVKSRFVHESGTYSEMETGATALAFADEASAPENCGFSFRATRPDADPPGVEIAFITDDVAGAVERAVRFGARLLKEPTKKPWGQTVAYVADLNGFAVELCTAIG